MSDSTQALQAAMQLHKAGYVAQAKTKYEQILAQHPNNADALHYLGMLHHQIGENQQAMELLRRSLELNPRNQVFFNNVATVYLLEGNGPEAIKLLLKARSIKPAFIEVHLNLGRAYEAMSNWDDAIDSYRKAIVLKPDLANAHYDVGRLYLLTGNVTQAANFLQRALTLQPTFYEAAFRYGLTLRALGRQADAMRHLQAALVIKPNSAEVLNAFGESCVDIGKPLVARIQFERAVALAPNNQVYLNNLAASTYLEGRHFEAITLLKQGLAVGPNGEISRRIAMLLPCIMGTHEEVHQSRIEFESNLDELMAKNEHFLFPDTLLTTANFYLAYHGENDKDLLLKLATYYETACPSLRFLAPHCAESTQIDASRKRRIGFFSRFINGHSIAVCFRRVIAGLANLDDLEIIVISCQSSDTSPPSSVDAYSAQRLVFLENSPLAAREQIAALQLDILVYLDIGLEPLSYLMSFARLAPVQCVMAGHPNTTGVRNIDYFLSPALAEPTDAQENYSEQLVVFPSGTFYFERPSVMPSTKTRSDFGLPDTATLYLCPMKLQKIHPDFDLIIGRILAHDLHAQIAFFEDQVYPTWGQILRARLDRTISQPSRDRIIFLPWLKDYADFMRIHALSDVVLDPVHFGIGSTAIAAFSVGTPLVTLPGRFLRGRVGLLYCKLLDLPECVATDVDDYVNKAVAIANTPSLRAGIYSKIMKKNKNIFESEETISDLAAFFRKVPLCGRAAPCGPNLVSLISPKPRS